MKSKNRFNSLWVFALFALFLLSGCDSNEVSEKQDDKAFTKEDAQKILDEYNIIEGTIVLKEEDFKRTNDYINAGKGSDRTERLQLTVEDFKKMVADVARYQQSKEGRIATRLGDFHRLQETNPMTKAQIDSFYQVVDKEFGTNIYEMRNRKLLPGEVRKVK